MISLEKILSNLNLPNLCTLIKVYVDKKVSDLASSVQDILVDLDEAVESKLSKAGGTMTGDLIVGNSKVQQNGYIIGKWLQGTASNHLGSEATKFAVQDKDGWIYHRTADEVKSDIGAGNCELVIFSNVSVATSVWASDSTYSDYPFKAAVTCSGVTADYIPNVVFGLTEATGGNFAPIAEAGEGTVCIYAKTKPTAVITLPVIECRKEM